MTINNGTRDLMEILDGLMRAQVRCDDEGIVAITTKHKHSVLTIMYTREEAQGLITAIDRAIECPKVTYAVEWGPGRG